MHLPARLLILALAAVACVSASPPARKLNWNTQVAMTPSGSHVVGNPQANVKLVEYISYTCPHCAHFEIEAGGPMRMAWVAPGKLSIEVRHFLRDPVDLTVAMLTNCGPPDRFFLNHAAFLHRQEKWIGTYDKAGPAQRQRWNTGDRAARMRAIASDFGFYEIMASRGYRRTDVDRCLANEPVAKRLAEMTATARATGVSGTPSFELDGLLLAGTHDWASLEPQIRARM